VLVTHCFEAAPPPSPASAVAAVVLVRPDQNSIPAHALVFGSSSPVVGQSQYPSSIHSSGIVVRASSSADDAVVRPNPIGHLIPLVFVAASSAASADADGNDGNDDDDDDLRC